MSIEMSATEMPNPSFGEGEKWQKKDNTNTDISICKTCSFTNILKNIKCRTHSKMFFGSFSSTGKYPSLLSSPINSSTLTNFQRSLRQFFV